MKGVFVQWHSKAHLYVFNFVIHMRPDKHPYGCYEGPKQWEETKCDHKARY